MSVEPKDKQVDVVPNPNEVPLTIDGIQITVPKGSLLIRAAEKLGIAIPRFCDHPLLDPMGACRQCMVEIPDMGNGRPAPGNKPQPACTTEALPNMVVQTQHSSAKAKKAQVGMLELLLINHPLDCPICDKGGECPLQNQAISNGAAESRYAGYAKRTFPKPVSISAQILLDRERCVLCARCTRFSEQISGDPFIALVERGALQQVGFYEDQPYNSYFSGNVAQICPVGALTSADYRFQARPFDLVSTTTACEHCAAGCELRVDHRHFQVKRRLAGLDMAVNEEWNCDKGRFGFVSGRGDDRITRPLIRENGELRPASWPEAIDAAVRGLANADGKVGVLTGGRLTVENAYGYAKFARIALGTNNIDFRSRPHTLEEGDFLAQVVAGKQLGEGVTYADLETAKRVVLVGFEPEEESPIVFLRLRKAVRKHKLSVVTMAAFLSEGCRKLNAELIMTVPGTEAAQVHNLNLDPETIVLVGERAALAYGTLSAVAQVAATSGCKLAWIPRRAGDRGAVEAGCLPHLLPRGRVVTNAKARVDMQAVWGFSPLPDQPGLDADAMLAAVAEGDLKAMLIAGVELNDVRNPQVACQQLEAAEFIVSLETRLSDVAKRANVVLPVSLCEEQAGSFMNFEHRTRSFETVIKQQRTPMNDLRVLAALADGLGRPLGIRTPAQARQELQELGSWQGDRPSIMERVPHHEPTGDLVLATWRLLLDESRGLDHADALKQTAPPACIRLSAATAATYRIDQMATVATDAGSITLPVVVTETMVDNVVWLPTNSVGSAVTAQLNACSGDVVRLSPASSTEGGAA